jgi:hypothetical protein
VLIFASCWLDEAWLSTPEIIEDTEAMSLSTNPSKITYTTVPKPRGYPKNAVNAWKKEKSLIHPAIYSVY